LTFDDGFTECYTIIAPILQENNLGAVFFINMNFIDNDILAYRSQVSLCMDAVDSAKREVETDIIADFNRRFGVNLKSSSLLKRYIYDLRADRLNLLTEICGFFHIDPVGYAKKYKPYLNSEQIKALSNMGFTIGSHGKDHRDLHLLPHREIESQIVDSCAYIAEITGQKQVPFSFPFGTCKLDKNYIAEIARKNPIIGKMYGIKGISLEPPFIHRVCLDAPAINNRSTIPAILHEEYAYCLQRKLFPNLTPNALLNIT